MTDDLSAGSTIGDYRLVSILGEGATGRVFEAEHLLGGRRVAVKVLRRSVTAPLARRRFFAEAHLLERVSHPNVVALEHRYEAADGGFFVMELLEGEDLASRLKRDPIQPLRRTLHITAQIADAMQTVHDARIVHRDLKPDNVFLIDRGDDPNFVKIVDFSVATLVSPSGDRKVGHTFFGTPDYMSPEQASGRPIDHRSDIYALGVMLYLMIAGHLPHEAATFGELILKHATEEITPPATRALSSREVAVLRDRLVLALLERDPDARPSSMGDVERRLRSIIEALDDEG